MNRILKKTPKKIRFPQRKLIKSENSKNLEDEQQLKQKPQFNQIMNQDEQNKQKREVEPKVEKFKYNLNNQWKFYEGWSNNSQQFQSINILYNLSSNLDFYEKQQRKIKLSLRTNSLKKTIQIQTRQIKYQINNDNQIKLNSIHKKHNKYGYRKNNGINQKVVHRNMNENQQKKVINSIHDKTFSHQQTNFQDKCKGFIFFQRNQQIRKFATKNSRKKKSLQQLFCSKNIQHISSQYQINSNLNQLSQKSIHNPFEDQKIFKLRS